MGLLDQVIGSVTGGKGGSMSPLTKALLALLAAKAASSYFGRDDAKAAEAPTGGATAPAPTSSGTIESGVLAGLPSLDALLGKLRESGLGDKVDSWVDRGDNKQVSPQDLDKALGPNTVDQLAKESGMPKDSLLRELSDALPKVIDKLTPDGKVPGPKDRAHW